MFKTPIRNRKIDLFPLSRMDGNFFTVMSEARTVSCILALKGKENPKMKDLQHITNHSQTLKARLDEMEAEGIICIKTVYRPKTYLISLTDKGNDIALLLSIADTIIPGELSTKSIDLKYADPLLRMLRGRDYVVQKEILTVIPVFASIKKVLSKMEEEGLVTIEENTDSHREVRYSLTPVGKKIADVFEAIHTKIVTVR